MSEAHSSEMEFLRNRIRILEEENVRFRRCVTVPDFPRVLGAPLRGINTLWIGPCHIEGFSMFAGRAGCTAQHLLYSSFPYENVSPFDPAPFDCIIVGLTLRNLLLSTGGEPAKDFQHLRPDWNSDNIEAFFNNCHTEMVRQIDNIYGQAGRKPIFFVPFLEPSFNFLGNLVKQGGQLDIATFVAQLNQGMQAHVSLLHSAYILDLNELTSCVGRMHLQDDLISFYTHAVFIGDFDVDLDEKTGRFVAPVKPTDIYDAPNRWRMLNEVMWGRLLDNMKILRQIDMVKLIIVDLDDTLWRGIAAEPLPHEADNEEHFRTIGWPMAFAEALLYFKKRGGLIAICSKNDHDATVERFHTLWGNRIKLEDFCSVRINWERKSENIAAILKEVNLLPESAVFIDDNPREIDEVLREFPGIRALGFQHYDWRRIILQAPEMQVAVISAESQQRTDLIRAKVARDAHSTDTSRIEWLHSLDIKVNFAAIHAVSDDTYGRAFELLNKTNQFNTTGRRWTSEEMGSLLDQGGYLLTMAVADRHANNGIVGIAVIKHETILQVVLSCRVFGMGVEDAFLRHIALRMSGSHAELTASEFATDRNLVSRDYFTRNGFVRGEHGIATLASEIPPSMPEWIEVHCPA
ncbi:MAG: HAD-IIIC family phosphatase [Rhodopila sp.]|jgi:FkbH-like protein